MVTIACASHGPRYPQRSKSSPSSLNLYNRHSMRALVREWRMRCVAPGLVIVVIAANETFRVKDDVLEVTMGGISSDVANGMISVGEGNP